jgi:hypothetical protein
MVARPGSRLAPRGDIDVSKQILGPAMTAASVSITLCLSLIPARGQAPTDPAGSSGELPITRSSAKVPTGTAPRLADGKPDFSGIWGSDRNFIFDISNALKKGEQLPIQPWALKLAKERLSKDDPEANCLPTGVPRLAPYPWTILQSAKMTNSGSTLQATLTPRSCTLSSVIAGPT